MGPKKAKKKGGNFDDDFEADFAEPADAPDVKDADGEAPQPAGERSGRQATTLRSSAPHMPGEA
jgi:hypothetical protein